MNIAIEAIGITDPGGAGVYSYQIIKNILELQRNKFEIRHPIRCPIFLNRGGMSYEINHKLGITVRRLFEKKLAKVIPKNENDG